MELRSRLWPRRCEYEQFTLERVRERLVSPRLGLIPRSPNSHTRAADMYLMTFISVPVCTVTVKATTPLVATTQSPNVTGISINGRNMASERVAIVCKIMAVGCWK